MTVLSDVMQEFVDILLKVPVNLTKPALALLGVLTVIDIVNQVYEVEEIDWIKWLVKKVVKVGILTWLITKWMWIIEEVMKGFILVAEKSFGKALESTKYLENPSELIDLSFKIGKQFFSLWDTLKFWSLTSYSNLIVYMFLIGGFFYIACTIVLTIIEFYFLAGLSIIFIPFGTIKVGEGYFQNTLRLVVSSAIKVCVISMIVFLSESILIKIMVNDKSQGAFLHVTTVILILAFLMSRLPALASSLATGNPSLDTNNLIKTGMGAMAMGMTALNHLLPEPKSNSGGASLLGSGNGSESKGTDTGTDLGRSVGSGIGGAVGSLFGGAGAKVGSKIGGAVGSVAGGVTSGVVGGAYSAGKLGISKLTGSNTSTSTGTTTGKADTSTSTGKTTSKADTSTSTGTTASKADTGTSTEGTVSKADTGTSTEGTASKADTGTSTEGTVSKADTGTSTEGTASKADTGTSTEGTASKADTGTSTEGTTSKADTGTSTEGTTSKADTGTGRVTATEESTKLNGKDIEKINKKG